MQNDLCRWHGILRRKKRQPQDPGSNKRTWGTLRLSIFLNKGRSDILFSIPMPTNINNFQPRATRLIRNILSIPARVDNLGKYTEIYNAAGQGVRLEKCTNTFVTFVEGSKARP
jgi:hypothetical protein